MLDKVNATIEAAKAVVARIEAMESLLGEIKNCEGFAVVTKNGVPFFVLLNNDQAKAVNGTSITIDNLADIKAQMLDLAVKRIESAVLKDKDVLRPFVDKPNGPISNPAALNKPSTTV